MNKIELKVEMIRHGDTATDLANALKIKIQTLSNKMSGDRGDFTQSEIAFIKDRYDLSPERVDEIFFASKMS